MEIKFTCSNPDCQQHIAVDDSSAGRWLRCPACEKVQRVPGKPNQSLFQALQRGSKERQKAQAKAEGVQVIPDTFLRRLRLLFACWTAGAAVFGLAFAGLHLHSMTKLPKHFNGMLQEICSVGDFRFAPAVNNAGNRLMYARNVEAGVGIYIANLTTLEQSQLALVDAPEESRMDYFHLFGWSPNDSRLVFSMTVDQPNRQLLICDGDGSLIKSVTTPQSLREGIWLSNNSLVLMDQFRKLYVFNLEENRDLGDFGRVGFVPLRQLADRDLPNSSFALSRVSDHSIAYAEGGNIWTLDIRTGENRQLTQMDNAAVDWLDYNCSSGENLFCMTQDNSELHRYLYRFNPSASQAAPVQLTSSLTFKGQWLYDGGVAYVGTHGNRNFLAVQAKKKDVCTNLFVGGHVYSYSLNPTKDKIYAVASVGYEPLSIWEYSIPEQNLRVIVPGMAQPFIFSHVVAPVDAVVTNLNQERVDYYYLPPPRIIAGKKYPAIIDCVTDSRCAAGSQFLANSGIFYVSANRNGLASFENLEYAYQDTLAVYSELLRNPNIDPHRIYIAGLSASTAVATQLVNDKPEMWRGLVLMSPVVFPDIPSHAHSFPSVLVSVGEDDQKGRVAGSEKLAGNACAGLVHVRVVVHKHAAHKFENTRLVKERYQAIAEFILTDF